MSFSNIKILHIDSNHPILWGQLQELGFTNHEDFTSSKEEIEEKIQDYHGIVIRSRFKIDATFLDKATNLKFIARVGAGLESIDCDYAVSKNITLNLMLFQDILLRKRVLHKLTIYVFLEKNGYCSGN